MEDNFSDIKFNGLEIQPIKLEIKNKENFKMNSTMNWVLKIAAKLFETFFNLASPEIKNLLNNFVIDLYNKAKATPNPFDDFAVKTLATILNIQLPD